MDLSKGVVVAELRFFLTVRRLCAGWDHGMVAKWIEEKMNHGIDYIERNEAAVYI